MVKIGRMLYRVRKCFRRLWFPPNPFNAPSRICVFGVFFTPFPIRFLCCHLPIFIIAFCADRTIPVTTFQELATPLGFSSFFLHVGLSQNDPIFAQTFFFSPKPLFGRCLTHFGFLLFRHSRQSGILFFVLFFRV